MTTLNARPNLPAVPPPQSPQPSLSGLASQLARGTAAVALSAGRTTRSVSRRLSHAISGELKSGLQLFTVATPGPLSAELCSRVSATSAQLPFVRSIPIC